MQERLGRAAGQLQSRTLALVLLVYICAFFAAAAQFLSNIPFVNDVKIATLVLAYGAFAFARRFDYENRYQDYRALSEALRTTYATACAGLPSDFAQTAYLSMQKSELQWIRRALRSIEVTAPQSTPQSTADCSREAREWVTGQRDYYQNATKTQAGHARFLNVAGAAVGALVALAGTLGTILPQHAHDVEARTGWLWPTVISADMQRWHLAHAGTSLQDPNATAPLAIGGLIALFLSNYAAKRGFAKNAKRYERMYLLFAQYARLLDGVTARSQAETDIIRNLAREALVEHADWLLGQREFSPECSALRKATFFGDAVCRNLPADTQSDAELAHHLTSVPYISSKGQQQQYSSATITSTASASIPRAKTLALTCSRFVAETSTQDRTRRVCIRVVGPKRPRA